MSSPAETKQMEPEGKQTSQVRLEWKAELGEEDLFFVHTICATPISSCIDVGWRGRVIAGCQEQQQQYFATKEEAQLWCESQLTELLQKDLKSLGGGGNAATPSITVPVQRTRTPGVSPLKLGEFDLEDGSKRTGELALHSAGSDLTAEGWEEMARLMEEATECTKRCARALREEGRHSVNFREAKRAWGRVVAQQMNLVGAGVGHA